MAQSVDAHVLANLLDRAELSKGPPVRTQVMALKAVYVMESGDLHAVSHRTEPRLSDSRLNSFRRVVSEQIDTCDFGKPPHHGAIERVTVEDRKLVLPSEVQVAEHLKQKLLVCLCSCRIEPSG